MSPCESDFVICGVVEIASPVGLKWDGLPVFSEFSGVITEEPLLQLTNMMVMNNTVYSRSEYFFLRKVGK